MLKNRGSFQLNKPFPPNSLIHLRIKEKKDLSKKISKRPKTNKRTKAKQGETNEKRTKEWM